MKRLIGTILLSTASLFSITSYAQLETYTIDPSHSYVEWHINHLGFSNQAGKWFANGTLELDKAHPKNSKVNVSIDVKDFVTGIPKLDEHLGGAEFFNTAEYPTATFVSTKVVPEGKDKAKIYGTLTLKGVSKPVTLHAKLNKEGVSAVTDKPTVGFSATTEIKRSDFGMTAFAPALGDNVKLNIELEAYKGEAAPEAATTTTETPAATTTTETPAATPAVPVTETTPPATETKTEVTTTPN